nr:MAG TPA: hypothetical protein [Bacteriophage sp.]
MVGSFLVRNRGNRLLLPILRNDTVLVLDFRFD